MNQSKAAQYVFQIDGKDYSVEIVDMASDPILVKVNGIDVRVNRIQVGSGEQAETTLKLAGNEDEAGSIAEPLQGENLFAPLPGTIIEIFVRDGDRIEKGQVLLIIEAMKMKNSIRATRSGKVARVLVTPGELVTHKQLLLEYEG